MKKILGILLTLSIIILATGCKGGNDAEKPAEKPAAEQKELTVSIAASTKNAIDEIVKKYEEENPGVKIKLNAGGSGTLEQQITGGAPVDIFLSASKKNMDNLEEKGYLLEGTREDLLKNSLVLIGSADVKDKIKTIADLKAGGVKIALGELNTVPAGKYAKQAFEKLDMWNEVEKEAIYQKDVTAVLTIVDSGEIETGVVYSSDALTLKNGFIIEEFAADTHDPVVYPAAIIKETKNKEEAEKFLEYLKNHSSKEIFEKYGFKL
jgi:molybdate transport system substrate-binding protein